MNCNSVQNEHASANEINAEDENEVSIDVETLDDVEESGEWGFETDIIALKGNKDYENIIRTIVMLEAQRVQAIKDIEAVSLLKEEALQQPMGFVAKLQRGESIGLPPRITVAKIPAIDWGRYSPDNPRILQEVDQALNPPSQPPPPPREADKQDEEDSTLVRGRTFDPTKPQTFNQLWTTEEQQRLEDLLVQFPPEAVEAKRWSKIARALGNRTTKQVSSRVQKYFIKLHRAGLPVPGRIPKALSIPSVRPYHQKMNRFLYRPSTFFPSFPLMEGVEEGSAMPVAGDRQRFAFEDYPDVDDEDDNGADSLPYGDTEDEEQEDEQDEKEEEGKCGEEEGGGEGESDEVGQETEDDEEESEDKDDEEEGDEENAPSSEERSKLTYELLKRVHDEKENHNVSRAKHYGYKCDFCQENPIRGARWHCSSCRATDDSVDFCTDCVVTQLYSVSPHPLRHRLVALREAARGAWGVHDRDYAVPSSAKQYNYLDPNFMAIGRAEK